ncbi:jg9771 [Pararge aegeria aegeria]|uniref:Jg9771 protein n=1 Tax=Pararge aegeria aegeria TaxID=348720 RepID=A0A8S4QCP6_9NEOP|nr:jg9771 [Pararge aegeria aegeria]
MGNPSDKGSGLGSAVQWCFYVSVIASCGYSFVRQQRLEQRLRLLEEHHFQLEETVFSFHEPQEDVLTRKARDVTDCICPSDRARAYKSAFIQLNTVDAGCRAV